MLELQIMRDILPGFLLFFSPGRGKELFSFTVLIKVWRKKGSSHIELFLHYSFDRFRDSRWKNLPGTVPILMWEVRESAYRSKIRASRLIYKPLPEMPFLTVPMTRNSPECKNLYQISCLWSTENHLAPGN